MIKIAWAWLMMIIPPPFTKLSNERTDGLIIFKIFFKYVFMQPIHSKIEKHNNNKKWEKNLNDLQTPFFLKKFLDLDDFIPRGTKMTNTGPFLWIGSLKIWNFTDI